MPTRRHLARTLLALSPLLWLGATPSASAQSRLSADEARRLATSFYDLLNRPGTKDLEKLVEPVLAADWRSYGSDSDFKGRDAFVGQLKGFGKVIPDLRWEIKDLLLADGNRFVVRGEASGTPVAPLFGVAPSGRSFRTMSIDIHTVRDGRIVATYHVEDWASALRQLSTP